MKYFAFICVVSAAVAHTVATPLHGLHGFDNRINSTIEDMQKLKEDFPKDASVKFNTSIQRTKDEITLLSYGTVQFIQEIILQAAAEGKDAQHCYENVELELINAENKIWPIVENCIEENTPDWTAHDVTFDKLIEKGEQLHERIVEIEENCASDNNLLFQKCISLGLREIARAHGIYKQSVGLLKRDLYSSIGTGVRGVNDCLENPLFDFKSELESIKIKALVCVESMQ